MATLTDKAIRAALLQAQREDRALRVADGDGLVLEARPTGVGWWRYRYRHGGKEGMLSLGIYPAVTLAQARERRDDLRRQVASGVNPSSARKASKEDAAIRAELQRLVEAGEALPGSFAAVAKDWLALGATKWASSYASKVKARLERDVLPYIGRRPIAEITGAELLTVLQRIQARGAIETGHRALQECSLVFEHAMPDLVKFNPTVGLARKLLQHTKRHFPAITTPVQLAQFLRAADGYTGTPVVRCALKLQAMLFTRPSELRLATWSEFDLDAATWLVPAARMKRRKDGKVNGTPHLVPLPHQAVELLQDLHALTGHQPWVFLGERHKDKPISENTVNAAMRGLGFDMETVTGHGFRATARTLLAESLGEPAHVIEAQLAHAVPDSLGRAYNRTQWIDMRTAMMQRWADYLDRLRKGADVVPIDQAARASTG
ncbi:tyrosine-type recombinase/integrase [Aquabacterium sp.]|uniref:tyrosine-type recombinase/integrase n=1 Tax=Aquabacterium sp. TaxID=1872578 RepID=UPI003784E92B